MTKQRLSINVHAVDFCQLFLTENLDLLRFVIYKMRILPEKTKTGPLYLVKYRIYGLDKAAYQMRHA